MDISSNQSPGVLVTIVAKRIIPRRSDSKQIILLSLIVYVNQEFGKACLGGSSWDLLRLLPGGEAELQGAGAAGPLSLSSLSLTPFLLVASGIQHVIYLYRAD